MNRLGPFFGCFTNRHEHQFQSGRLVRIDLPVPRELADYAVHRFDGVGRVDRSADRRREVEQRDPQVHAEPQDLPQRGVGVEDRVHGDSRGVETMDDADSPLEAGVKPFRHPVRGPHARANQQLACPARLTQKFSQARQ